MTSLSKTVFVNENENIFEVFHAEGVEYDTQVFKNLQFISNKTSNNYIGYYQFKSSNKNSEVCYKVYVLPKTSPKVNNEQENKKYFIKILQEYYRLKNKYGVKVPYVKKSIIDLAVDDNKNEQNANDMDTFIAYKYAEAIKTIKTFFKKHNNILHKELKYSAQNIRDRLDVKRNITELDKSKIHQHKKVAYRYSEYALISSEVLHYFIKNKLKDVKDKQLGSVTRKLKAKIDSKYLQHTAYTFRIKDIVSKKITKLFKSSEEKELYRALLQLLGAENYFEDQSNKMIFKLHNQHALFFRPEELFEWAVFDMLNDEYGEASVTQKQKISYKINDASRDAYPDFVVRKGNEVLVIDAKWKILKTEEKISFEDIAKLRRDGLILEKVTKSILIYPQIPFEDRKFKLSVDDFDFEIYTIDEYRKGLEDRARSR